MVPGDKIKSATDKVVGTVKETVGKVTDNPELELKGKVQKLEGEFKDKFEDILDKVKDEADDVKENVLEKVNELVDKVSGKDKKD